MLVVLWVCGQRICVVQAKRHIHSSRGRFMDNIFIERLWRSVKYEEVHLKAYADGREARAGIGSWMTFYNFRRPH